MQITNVVGHRAKQFRTKHLPTNHLYPLATQATCVAKPLITTNTCLRAKQDVAQEKQLLLGIYFTYGVILPLNVTPIFGPAKQQVL